MIMSIKNFHKESTTDHNGKSKTRKVYTHKAKAPFLFSEWLDKSPPPETLDYLSVLHLTRLFTHKIINLSARASGSYEV